MLYNNLPITIGTTRTTKCIPGDMRYTPRVWYTIMNNDDDAILFRVALRSCNIIIIILCYKIERSCDIYFNIIITLCKYYYSLITIEMIPIESRPFECSDNNKTR